MAEQPPEVEIITEPPSQPAEPPSEPVEPQAETPLPSEGPGKPAPRKEPLGRLRVGGGLGLGFGTGFVLVGVSPQVSYIFKRIVEPGAAFRYEFIKDSFATPDVKWNTYGGSLFVRLFPIQTLFFLVEGEIINAGFRQGDFRSGRTNYGNLLLGGGFLLGVGRGAFFATSLKFAVFRNPFYPNAFPIVSVGAGYAF
jgi:hypothetical protein